MNMRGYVAIGAAAAVLTYFLDPENGRWRRQALRAWLNEAVRRMRQPIAAVPEEMPVEPAGNGRPAVEEERPPPMVAPVREPEPAAVSVLATPEPKEPPGSVAVGERPAPEAMLPPPLPPDVVETPAPEPTQVQVEPEIPARRSRRGWVIGGGAVLFAASLAAAAVAAFAFDVVDTSDDEEPTASSSALNALAQRQARAISIMAQPGATRIPVVGAEERLLLVVGMEGDAVLIVSRLPEAPAGKTYEIWVISGKTPRPAGLFRGGRDAVVPLTRAVPKGATVALTLERLGGSLKPTSEPIYAVTRS
jgi:anti-sigma-K factor RskA